MKLRQPDWSFADVIRVVTQRLIISADKRCVTTLKTAATENTRLGFQNNETDAKPIP